jgi:hypothetical protein
MFSKYILTRKNQIKSKASHDITEILFKVALSTINHHYVKIYMTNLLVNMENAPIQVWILIYHSKRYKPLPGFPTCHIWSSFCMFSELMWGDCSFCWYWWNCWPYQKSAKVTYAWEGAEQDMYFVVIGVSLTIQYLC